MLDRTYSMTIKAGSFGKTFDMRAPYAAVYDPVAGNYWVAEEFEAGITRWDQDQDPSINQKLDYSIWSTTNVLGGNCPTISTEFQSIGVHKRYIVNPIQIETWNGLIFTANSSPQNPDKGKVKTFNPLIQQKKDEVVRANNETTDSDTLSLIHI